MSMSYRRAWLLMQSLNESLASPASVAAKGGRHGGGATLTPLGHALIRSYRSFEAGVTRESRQRFKPFAPAAPGARLRDDEPAQRTDGTDHVTGSWGLP